MRRLLLLFLFIAGCASNVELVLEDSYDVNESILVSIKNNGKVPVGYNPEFQACYTTFTDDAGREFLVPAGTHCDLMFVRYIQPGETKPIFRWDLDECVYDTWGCSEENRLPLLPGVYHIETILTTEYQTRITVSGDVKINECQGEFCDMIYEARKAYAEELALRKKMASEVAECEKNKEYKMPEDKVGRCNESKEIEFCYIDYAVEQKDPEICKYIKTEVRNSMCYRDVAIALNDSNLCEKACSLSHMCYEQIAIQTGNIGLCDNIFFRSTSFKHCVYGVAQTTGNLSHCQKLIDGSSAKGICIRNLEDRAQE